MNKRVNILTISAKETIDGSLFKCIQQTGYDLETLCLLDPEKNLGDINQEDWQLIILHMPSVQDELTNIITTIKNENTNVPIIGLFPQYDPSNYLNAMMVGVNVCCVETDYELMTYIIRHELDYYFEHFSAICNAALLEESEKHREELLSQLKQISQQKEFNDDGFATEDYLEEKLQNILHNLESSDLTPILLFGKIDNYEKVQKALGDGFDEKISTIYQNIKDLTSNDEIIAHLSVDEFSVLGLYADEHDADSLAKGIQTAISKIASHHIPQLTLSIVVYAIKDKSTIASNIINSSREQCIKLQFDGGNQIKHYQTNTSLKKIYKRKALIEKTEDALSKGTLNLVFQPIVNLHGEAIELYEVLSRLKTHSGENVPIGEIVALGDDNILKQIDRRVIRNTLKILHEQQAEGNHFQVFAHLSIASILEETFLEWLKEQIKGVNIHKHSLVFEINENDAILHQREVQSFITQIKALGVQASLNQFGKHAKSINLLKALPLQFVKIHGSFTANVNESKTHEIELKRIVDAAHNEAKIVVVPLVEHATSLSALWRCGVNYVQGYYLQMPETFLNYNFHATDEPKAINH